MDSRLVGGGFSKEGQKNRAAVELAEPASAMSRLSRNACKGVMTANRMLTVTSIMMPEKLLTVLSIAK